jgi:hypothetical protein
MSGASDRVGPVLAGGVAARAVLAAIVEAFPDAEIIDHGSYVRVLVRGRCAVTRDAIARHAGASFTLPGDLEAVMPSFRGRFRVTDEVAEWIA